MLTDYQKAVVQDMVDSDVECGMPNDDFNALRMMFADDPDFNRNMNDVDDAANLYLELVNGDVDRVDESAEDKMSKVKRNFTDKELSIIEKLCILYDWELKPENAWDVIDYGDDTALVIFGDPRDENAQESYHYDYENDCVIDGEKEAVIKDLNEAFSVFNEGRAIPEKAIAVTRNIIGDLLYDIIRNPNGTVLFVLDTEDEDKLCTIKNLLYDYFCDQLDKDERPSVEIGKRYEFDGRQDHPVDGENRVCVLLYWRWQMKELKESRNEDFFESDTILTNCIYIGDPCYFMLEDIYNEWGARYNYKDGIIESKLRNSAFIVCGTKYGDGEYDSDQNGKKFPVDAGCICIADGNLGDVKKLKSAKECGLFIPLPKLAPTTISLSYEDGTITAKYSQGKTSRSVSIFTNEDEDDSWEDDEWEDDSDDWEDDVDDSDELNESTTCLRILYGKRVPANITAIDEEVKDEYQKLTGHKYNTDLYFMPGLGDVYIVFTTLEYRDAMRLLTPIVDKLKVTHGNMKFTVSTCTYGGCIIISNGIHTCEVCGMPATESLRGSSNEFIRTAIEQFGCSQDGYVCLDCCDKIGDAVDDAYGTGFEGIEFYEESTHRMKESVAISTLEEFQSAPYSTSFDGCTQVYIYSGDYETEYRKIKQNCWQHILNSPYGIGGTLTDEQMFEKSSRADRTVACYPDGN